MELASLGCEEFKCLSKWLTNAPTFCLDLRKCNNTNCKRRHEVPLEWQQDARDNIPRLIAYLFLRPAVRRGLALSSFARDSYQRFLCIREPELNFKLLLKIIRDLSFPQLHESGYRFNVWSMVKLDSSHFSHVSAVQHFLAIYLSIMKNDARARCSNQIACRMLTCNKVHFEVTPIDQVGAFRWIMRILLIEADDKWHIFKSSDDIKKALNGCSLRCGNDMQTCNSIVSQFASLLLLANLGLDCDRQVKQSIQNFGLGLDIASKELEDLDTADLDSGRLLDSCFDTLSGGSQSHRLLTVSQYGCAIGETYMSILLGVFRSTLAKQLKKGTQLPSGITLDAYNQMMKKSEKVVYTMAMHLWLFKTLSCEAIAKELQTLQVRGFKVLEKGTVTVIGWKEAVCNRNPKWLKAMKTPDAHDMRAACENFMPTWIKGFSLLIRKGASSSVPSQQSRSLQMARQRWQDEPFVLDNHIHGTEDEITDWRKICRLLRDHELLLDQKSNRLPMTPARQERAALLNYLLHASNRLKHTDYASFDPELFLFFIRRLLTLYSVEARRGRLHLLEHVVDTKQPLSPFPKQGGHPRSGHLQTVKQMSVQESVEIKERLMELSLEFLPLEGKYLCKWTVVDPVICIDDDDETNLQKENVDDQTRELGQALAGLVLL